MSESESEEEVILPKSMPLDKHWLKASLLIIRSSLMKPAKEKSRNCCYSMIEDSLSPIQEDVNPRSSEEEEPELEDKRVIDDSLIYIN